jgi:Domain of unknown function (DUF4149)
VTILRLLMLLALAVWIGALIFFPVVAQTAFANLQSHWAGLVVRGSLLKLHWMAFICGTSFLAGSLIHNRTVLGRTRLLSASHFLIVIMLALTAISQFQIIPRMDQLRASVGEISMVPIAAPARAQFDTLHAWSTRIEGAILVLGLLVLYLTSRRLTART